MMHMFNSTGGLGSSLFWLHVHFVFTAIAVVGGILFTVWAIKNLKGATLKSIALWTVAIGIIGTLVTAPMGTGAWSWMMGGKSGGHGSCPMMQGKHSHMMQMMKEHHKDDPHPDHEQMLEKMEGSWHDSDGHVRE